MRPTESVVDLGAIRRNVERLVAHAFPAQVCVVTKADAYGHGSVACTRAALEAGATWVAVALVEEGIELRESGVVAPILLLSEPRPGDMAEAVDAGLTPTVYSPDGIAAVAAVAASEWCKSPVSVHLNLDTGMNRVGLRPSAPIEATDHVDYSSKVVRSIINQPNIRLGGVWTHLAVADEPERPETAHQLARFGRAVESVRCDLPSDVLIHAANSAGLLGQADADFDMVRVGISAYGIEPAPGIGSMLGLEPALQLTTELSMVKPVFAGESLSYGLRHTFRSNTVVGTIPIGYADGLRRDSFARGGQVLVGGVRCPLVGTVTMDQAMIDLGAGSAARTGDSVVLIGSQGDETITVHEIARRLDTIPYEVVCGIGERVRRRYV